MHGYLFAYSKCFFTGEKPIQLKQEFMSCINRACQGGGLFTCSFRENVFADYFLFKKRLSEHLGVKTSVSYLGPTG